MDVSGPRDDRQRKCFVVHGGRRQQNDVYRPVFLQHLYRPAPGRLQRAGFEWPDARECVPRSRRHDSNRHQRQPSSAHRHYRPQPDVRCVVGRDDPRCKGQGRPLRCRRTLCASSFSAGATALANMPTTATLTQIGWTGSCPLPVTTSTLTATLLNIVFPPGTSHGTRTDYIVQSFPIGFTFTPYPAPPAGAPQTAPVVSSLDWQNPVPGCGTPKCGLVFDDFPSAICNAYEVDGAPVTVTIAWTWDTGSTATGTIAFPAGASALSRTVNGRLIRGAEAIVGKAVPQYPKGQSPRATAVCTVTNDRGQSATKTIQIPDGGLSRPPSTRRTRRTCYRSRMAASPYVPLSASEFDRARFPTPARSMSRGRAGSVSRCARLPFRKASRP